MAAIKRVILPSVPGTGALAEGTEVFVEDGSGGLDLYIGNSSNNPVLVSANQFALNDSIFKTTEIYTNPPQAGQDFYIEKSLGNTPGNEAFVILIGGASTNETSNISGTIYGKTHLYHNRDAIKVDFASIIDPDASPGIKSIALSVFKAHQNTHVALVECDYNTNHYYAIRFFGTSANWYPQRLFFSGAKRLRNNSENYPVVVLESNVSNITSATLDDSIIHYFTDRAKFSGKVVAKNGIGVGNAASATTPGSVTNKMEVFDMSGNSLGFVAVYDSIT